MFRTIRSICLTMLVCLAGLGVGSYFAAQALGGPSTSSAMLFALSFTFGGWGLIGAAGTVIGLLNGKKFGTDRFAIQLFQVVGIVTLCIVILLGLVAIGAASVVTRPGGDGGSFFDGTRFVSIYCSGLVGYVIGFVVILVVNGRSSWFGESERKGEVHEFHSGRGAA